MDYKQIILDHYKSPVNQGQMENPDIEVNEANSSCGDVIKVQLKLNGDKIEKMQWQSVGCAISTASASILSESVVGKSVDDVLKMTEGDLKQIMGEVNAGRAKCASLPLRALQNAIKKYEK